MEDRLSILPDPILCHILSFLPTNQAVATSVLSKTWKPLWRSVPVLNFFCYNTTTERFVNAVMLSRDHNQPIHKFELVYNSCNSVDPVNIELWVNNAVQHSLQHLHLCLRLDSCLSRPAKLSSIFSCATLVVLKLNHLDLEPLSCVDLPLLKVLHLEYLSFSTLQSFAELLSGCPGLEYLKVSALLFKNYVTDREFKTLPKLLRADIKISDHTYFLLKVVNNAQFLYLDEIDDDDDIDEVTDPYFSPMFYNLTHVELVYRYYISDWSQIVKLLQHCPMLQDLVIKQAECWVLDYRQDEEKIGDWKFPPSVPECVKLHLKSCYLGDYRGSPDEFRFARYIMRNGRFLKRMTICSYEVKQRQKLKNLKKLSSCTRRSATCRLSFK